MNGQECVDDWMGCWILPPPFRPRFILKEKLLPRRSLLTLTDVELLTDRVRSRVSSADAAGAMALNIRSSMYDQ